MDWLKKFSGLQGIKMAKTRFHKRLRTRLRKSLQVFVYGFIPKPFMKMKFACSPGYKLSMCYCYCS